MNKQWMAVSGWWLAAMAASVVGDIEAAQLVPLGKAEVGFRMHLGCMREAGMDVSASEMEKFAVRQEGERIVGEWRGHPKLGSDFVVTATFDKLEEGWEYGLAWDGLKVEGVGVGGGVGVGEKWVVETVSFPELTVPRSDKSGIVYSRAHGMGMVRRPNWNKWAKDPKAGMSSPMREFQFAALIDKSLACWYLDARDDQARMKHTYASEGVVRKFKVKGVERVEKRARIGIMAPLPAIVENGAKRELPWKGLIRPFHGGWWDAAQIYKPWALKQPWVTKARARMATPQARRLREICFWAWNRGNAATVVPPFERFMDDSGVSCALDWYWWHHQSYDTEYPRFWPPRDGEQAFADTIARLHRKGAYAMVYTNGMSWDMDDESWHYGEGGEKQARVGHDGKIFGELWNIHMSTPHRLAATCGEGRGFQRLLGEVIGHLDDAGLDAVYLDQISCGTGKPCWNRAHSHLPGDGLGDMLGYYRFVKELRAAHPKMAFASEETTEAYLGEFDHFISLFGTSYERCGLGTLPEYEAVPIWNALYHGMAAVFGSYSLMDGVPAWDDERWPATNKWTQAQEKDWPALYPDQFAVEFCRTVVWGNQPSAHVMRMEHATLPKFAADYRFMVDTAKFYSQHREYLFDGELLCPGRMECARKKVKFASRGIYNRAGVYKEHVQPALPTVFHNVWRSPEGKVAAILVNWSKEPQKYKLLAPDMCVTGVIPARSWAIRTDSAAPIKVSEWFGYDAEDSTRFLQEALGSGLPEIVIDRKDGPWVTCPLRAKSNQRIVFEPGVVLLAKRGAFRGRNDRMLSVWDCDNVEIVGNGATFRMWREDYATGEGYRRGEWRHTLSISNSRKVTVDGLQLEESGGDGICVSGEDIVIRNCVCDRNHRQGLSIICGRNLLVEDCVFKNTRGTAPEDGIDIEPNKVDEHCVNIVIRNCVSENNAGNGFEAALTHLRAGVPVSIRFENCRSDGDRRGMKFRTKVDPRQPQYPTGSVVFDRCQFTRTRCDAIAVMQVPESSYAMEFNDCQFSRIGEENPDAPLVVRWSVYRGDPKPAMPKFRNLDWPDRGKHPMDVLQTLDPTERGIAALPVREVGKWVTRVVDRRPGEMVGLEPIEVASAAKYYFYADRAKEVRFTALRAGVPTNIVQTVSAAGVYELDLGNLGKDVLVLTGANVPVALDSTTQILRQVNRRPLCLRRPNGRLYVPLAAGERAEFRLSGSTAVDGERVGVSIVDPSGKEAWAEPALLYATQYQTPSATEDGVWELRLGKPSFGVYGNMSIELAGVQPLLFLFPDRYWLGAQAGAVAAPISRYRFDAGEGAPKLFYDAYQPIEQGSKAEIAIVFIHGWGGRVGKVLPVFNAALVKRAGSAELAPPVFAPQFPRRETMVRNHEPDDGRAVWCDSWANEDRHPTEPGLAADDWRGGGDANGTTYSSYDYIDAIFARLADRKRYPNLRKVVLAGFSAGGQFAGRYAATGKGVVREGVKVEYIAMSPSTEFRFDADQPWLYGLKGRPRYSAALTNDEIMRNLCSRRVWRGCGSQDILGRPQTSLDMTPPAVLQGTNRFERFKSFERYLDRYPAWKKQVSFHVFEGIGHNESQCYPDPALLDFIFTAQR